MKVVNNWNGCPGDMCVRGSEVERVWIQTSCMTYWLTISEDSWHFGA